MTSSGLSGLSVFEESVAELLGRAECRRAEAADDREAIFRLRYRSYLREGAVAPRADERFEDTYDQKPNGSSFGVYIDGRLASSLRLSVANSACQDLPALAVFPDVLLPMLAAGDVIVDPTRFVVDLDMAKRYPKLPYITVRIGWLALEYYRANVSLATVRSEHQAFYRRLFGHRPICPARPYPSLLKPISALALRYTEAERERVHRRYPFLRSTPAERQELFAPAAGQAHGNAQSGSALHARDGAWPAARRACR